MILKWFSNCHTHTWHTHSWCLANMVGLKCILVSKTAWKDLHITNVLCQRAQYCTVLPATEELWQCIWETLSLNRTCFRMFIQYLVCHYSFMSFTTTFNSKTMAINKLPEQPTLLGRLEPWLGKYVHYSSSSPLCWMVLMLGLEQANQVLSHWSLEIISVLILLCAQVFCLDRTAATVGLLSKISLCILAIDRLELMGLVKTMKQPQTKCSLWNLLFIYL